MHEILYLKRLNIILDEDSDGGFGLVSHSSVDLGLVLIASL